MNDSKWWLVCYDVHDPARLRRAAKSWKGPGQRMQYSVFRCWMNPTQMQRLRWELTQVLEPEDDVLIIPLCSRCVAGMETTHSAQNVPTGPTPRSRTTSSDACRQPRFARGLFRRCVQNQAPEAVCRSRRSIPSQAASEY